MDIILHVPTGEFVYSWFFGVESNENSIHVRIRKTPSSDPDRAHLDHVMFSWDKIYIHQLYDTDNPQMPQLERIFEASIEEFEYCSKD